ncbi:uncharacterized protein LOC124163570 [Ischnura elegans]|uniref:uncharacterized protein LOC124163570 n=1 Tax=Ischnura elegans TaxID=197161 RepID=UPI001ED8A5F5|nr:uncharacterized protein LOC124163570 [Ischnura elegans]
MEEDKCPRDNVKDASQAEVIDSQPVDCSQLHTNLLAMLALKFMLEEEITDLRMITLKTVQGVSQSPVDNVVFTCKRHKDESKQERSCLIMPCHELSLEGKSETANQDLCSYFTELFKRYTTLMEETDQGFNLGNIQEVLIYFNNSSGMYSQNMLLESEVRDFIFGSKLFKWKSDFGVRKELLARVSIQLNPNVFVNSLENSCSFPESSILQFHDKVAFVRGPDPMQLVTSAKLVVDKYASNMDSDSTVESLMAIIRNLWKNRKVEKQNLFTSTDFKQLFAEVFSGLGKGNKVGMKYNLSGPVSDFVGRESQLKQLMEILQTENSSSKASSCTKVVLVGLGGVGKSELVREYCRRHFISHYDNILWINAESAEAIEACFKTLAFQELGIEATTSGGKLKSIFAVIQEMIGKIRNQRTLLVYDKARSLKIIRKYLPCNAKFCNHNFPHIIITSQFQDWEGLPMITLGCFKPEEAVAVLKRSLGQMTSWKEEDGKVLCRELGYYPLAIKQAISYIHEKIVQDGPKDTDRVLRSPITDYLQLLKENCEVVLDHPFKKGVVGNAETTFNTLLNTIDHLKKSLNGQVAITFLNIASYLSPDSINIEYMSRADPKYSFGVMEKSFLLLSKLFVMSIDGSNARVHRLIQLVNRIRLRKLGLEMDVLRSTMNLALKMDAQHVMNVWEIFKEYPLLVKEYASSLADVCEDLNCNRNYETALNFSQAALPILTTQLGDSAEEVIRFETHKAQCYFVLGQYDDAERFLKGHLYKWKNTTLHGDDPYFLGMFLWGSLFEVRGRLDEALDIFNELCFREGNHPPRISLFRLKRITLMLKKGVFDEKEWTFIEETSQLAYNTIRSRIEMMGYDQGASASLSSPGIPRVFSKSILGKFNSALDDVIIMVFHCYQSLPMKTDKWEEAYKVSKWCLDVLSKYGHNCRFIVERGRLQLVMMLGKLQNLKFVYNELMELSSKVNADDNEEAYSIVNAMMGRVFCLLGRFDEGIPKLLNSCFSRSRDVIIDDALEFFWYTVNEVSMSGNSDKVSFIVDKMLSEMLKNVGEKALPLVFLENCANVCNKLFLEYSRKLEAMNLLKRIYQCLKIKVGENHPVTLQAKILFAMFYFGFGKKRTIKKGILYLQEVRDLLLVMSHTKDLTYLNMLREVDVNLRLFILALEANS